MKKEGEIVSQKCKTFNSISNDDDILQMYLKDVGKFRFVIVSGRKEIRKNYSGRKI